MAKNPLIPDDRKQFISATITINQDESLSSLDCTSISQQICIIFCQSLSDLHHQSDTHDENEFA